MANRVLRDWTRSEKMDSLSAGAEVFFTRLIMKADDFGSYYANPKLLKADLFPLRDIDLSEISKWLFECIDAGLIFLYTAEDKEFLRIIDFGQRLRNMRNAFPHPPEGAESDSPRIAASRGECPPETETETKQETETETEPTADADGAKKKVDDEIPFSDGSPVRSAWNEWEKYRKEKKQRLTPSTIKKQLQFLGGRGDPEIIAIINQSIRNGWTGLFELKKQYSHDRKANKRTSDAVIEGGRDFGSF